MLKFDQGVTLLGGGAMTSRTLQAALDRAPILVCADGGANRVAGSDLNPHAIIGDLDSLSDKQNWRSRAVKLIHVAEQDSTDFQKCLSHIDAPFFICVGFLGRRHDHALAAMDAMIGDGRPLLALGEDDICFAPPGEVRLTLPPGARLSIFPLRPITASGGEGLKYPIDGLAMEAGRQIGVSNEMAAGQAAFGFDRPGAIVFFDPDHLDLALNSLGDLFQPPI